VATAAATPACAAGIPDSAVLAIPLWPGGCEVAADLHQAAAVRDAAGQDPPLCRARARSPGNEEQRLELLREHQRHVENQLAELDECLQIINRKVGVYEQHLADGTAQHLYTAEA
jgi:hypothetical protein